MFNYIARRILLMIPTLVAISMLIFFLIQLPPGDAITSRLAQLQAEGSEISEEAIAALRARFYLDDPVHVQYLRWVGGFFRGDLGYSVVHEQPVSTLVGDRLGYTMLIAVGSVLFTWVIAFPLGFYSAIRQYSTSDYVFTIFAFLGMATPNFLLALVLMYLGHTYFGISVGGLISPEFMGQPYSFAKLVDLLKHIWIPMVVVGTAGTAGLVRILRANLLDELQKPYVITARAKGLKSLNLIFKYPVRIAINPFISTVGWMLPAIFSGDAIVGVVLNLPTIGPLLLESLMTQDMYLAGSILLIMSALTVFGTLVSDLLLAAIDPRIRYD
ncbi:MAG: ABC transporter permease [Verrucomicrobia bacterium]|nr:ABC transporter permease [Verrucomicrobiota bacterium]MCH8528882.1 ABC transporter permease [Kiritimatiellia bacterium]